jgi:3-hydroxyisobutyrate dehydrogenase
MFKGAKIGWIGTGVMGKSMAGHLMTKGQLSLQVSDRFQSACDPLVKQGATFMSPVEIAKQADYLFIMLGYPRDVETMVLDKKDGLFAHMKKGSFLIDHTTSSPSLNMRMAEEAKELGISCVDAPVSGGDVGAKNGKLVTMVGGQKDHVDHVRPLLDMYSAQVELMGEAGAGQHAKAANQIMIANNLFGVCEALIYGQKSGLNLDQMVQLLSKGAAGSFQLSGLAPRILKRDLDPGFFVEHFVKDLGIALDECKRMGIALPGMSQSTQFFHAYVAQGGAKRGTHGLIEVLEKMNNMQISKYDI